VTLLVRSSNVLVADCSLAVQKTAVASARASRKCSHLIVSVVGSVETPQRASKSDSMQAEQRQEVILACTRAPLLGSGRNDLSCKPEPWSFGRCVGTAHLTVQHTVRKIKNHTIPALGRPPYRLRCHLLPFVAGARRYRGRNSPRTPD